MAVLRLLLGVALIGIPPTLGLGSSQSLETRTIYTSQPDAPVEVSFYTARYRERSPERPEGIHHQAGYMNRTDRLIVAVRLGFVSFSVFNEFIDRTYGVDISDVKPGEEGGGLWVERFAPADFSFLTGVVFVDRVRFESSGGQAAALHPAADRAGVRRAPADGHQVGAGGLPGGEAWSSRLRTRSGRSGPTAVRAAERSAGARLG